MLRNRHFTAGPRPGALAPLICDVQACSPIPDEAGIVPVLLDQVRPVHEVVAVDHFLPGCPPPAPRIRAVLEALLAGKTPELQPAERRFG